MNQFGRVAAYLSSLYWCVYSVQCTVQSKCVIGVCVCVQCIVQSESVIGVCVCVCVCTVHSAQGDCYWCVYVYVCVCVQCTVSLY
jgi:hypothetical protein